LTVRALICKSRAPPATPAVIFGDGKVSLTGESKVQQHASATRSLRPRSGSIKQACSRYGIGRSSLYQKAACTPGLFKKWGTKTLVDYEIMDKVFSELPPAEIKLPLSKARRG
jgi:hypothetical protein